MQTPGTVLYDGQGGKHKKVCDSRVQPYTGLGPSKSGGRSIWSVTSCRLGGKKQLRCCCWG